MTGTPAVDGAPRTALWPAGSATGVGSLPGTDITEALRVVLGELPELPHLPELPARGPGADMIGRGAALLVELPIELYAARWRVASRPGRDLRIARDFWARDLDALAEEAGGHTGTFKIQTAGPWTLAAGLELPLGGALLHDHGAARDLAASLTDGLRAHVADVRARLPRATVLLQIDEPGLPAVLAGRVPTESGFGTLRAVAPALVRDTYAALVAAVGVPVIVHCCASDPPLGLLRESGVGGVSIDLDLVGALDPLGELIDAGLGVFAGALDTRVPARPPSSAAVADRVLKVWRDLGFPDKQVAGQVVVTPACGLAGAPAERIRPILKVIRDAGRRLLEVSEEA